MAKGTARRPARLRAITPAGERIANLPTKPGRMFIIGRGVNADLRFENTPEFAHVSNRHCHIVYDERRQGYLIADGVPGGRGSTVGTFINDMRIGAMYVPFRPADVVTLGDRPGTVRLTLELPAATPEGLANAAGLDRMDEPDEAASADTVPSEAASMGMTRPASRVEADPQPQPSPMRGRPPDVRDFDPDSPTDPAPEPLPLLHQGADGLPQPRLPWLARALILTLLGAMIFTVGAFIMRDFALQRTLADVSYADLRLLLALVTLVTYAGTFTLLGIALNFLLPYVRPVALLLVGLAIGAVNAAAALSATAYPGELDPLLAWGLHALEAAALLVVFTPLNPFSTAREWLSPAGVLVLIIVTLTLLAGIDWLNDTVLRDFIADSGTTAAQVQRSRLSFLLIGALRGAGYAFILNAAYSRFKR